MALTTLTHTGRSGETDLYHLTLEDGSEHRFVVTKAERVVDGDNGLKAVRRAIADARAKVTANG